MKSTKLTPEQQQFVIDNEPLIKWFIQHYPHSQLYDDIYCVLGERLCLCAQHYNPEKGRASTYIIHSFIGVLHNLYYNERVNSKHTALTFASSLDSMCNTTHTDEGSITLLDVIPIVDHGLTEAEIEASIDALKVSDRAKDMTKCMLYGQSMADIARNNNCSRQNVQQTINRVINMLKF